MRETLKTLSTPANLVTFTRIIMLVALVFALQFNEQWIRIAAFALIPVIFYMDSLDGMLARKLNCATKVGGILDIAGDRIVENVLWVLLAYLDIIPLWIPIVILVRGFITDAFRSAAISKGHSTFSMMDSKIGWWFVASPLSRTTYAVAKAILFTIGIGIWSFHLAQFNWLMVSFNSLLYFTVILCLLRGFYAVRACLKSI